MLPTHVSYVFQPEYPPPSGLGVNAFSPVPVYTNSYFITIFLHDSIAKHASLLAVLSNNDDIELKGIRWERP